MKLYPWLSRVGLRSKPKRWLSCRLLLLSLCLMTDVIWVLSSQVCFIVRIISWWNMLRRPVFIQHLLYEVCGKGLLLLILFYWHCRLLLNSFVLQDNRPLVCRIVWMIYYFIVILMIWNDYLIRWWRWGRQSDNAILVAKSEELFGCRIVNAVAWWWARRFLVLLIIQR